MLSCCSSVFLYCTCEIVLLFLCLRSQIYAISYFFDRAADVGLVHPLDGGTITVLQLMMMAKTVCDSPNQDQPLACLDFSYIVTLLRTSLQLEAGTELHLRKRIDGHETSWALGAAFHTLTNQG